MCKDLNIFRNYLLITCTSNELCYSNFSYLADWWKHNCLRRENSLN